MTGLRRILCVLLCLTVSSCVGTSTGTTDSNTSDNTVIDNTNDNSTSDDTNVNTNDNTNENDIVFYPEGDAAAGSILFLDINNACYVCHGNDGLGTEVHPASIRSTTAADMQEAIGAGSSHTGGEHPGFSSQDYADLEAYLTGDPIDTTTNGETDTNGTTT